MRFGIMEVESQKTELFRHIKELQLIYYSGKLEKAGLDQMNEVNDLLYEVLKKINRELEV